MILEKKTKSPLCAIKHCHSRQLLSRSRTWLVAISV